MSVAAGSDPFTNALMRAKEIAANIKKPTGREEEEEYEDTYDNRKRPLNGAGGNVQSEFDGHYPPEGQPQSKRPMMDGGGGGYNPMNQQSEGLKDEIRVPSSCVKFLIGDNGETLSKLQSHCNVHIPPPGPDPHAERAIILTGSKQCIEQCKEQIRDVLQKNAGAGGGMPPMGGMGQMQGGYGGQMGQGGSPQMPIETVDMLIPQNKVGLIIGKGGETIKDLQVQSGCRMNMVQDGMYQNAPEKPLRMSGDTAAIQKARELVSGLLQQDFGGRGNNNNSNFRPNNGPFECTKNLAVPKEYVGVVIGRSGDTIRRLQEETGCKVQFNTVDQGQPGDRWLIMQGTQEACEKAESNVKDMLGKVMQKDAKFGGPNTQTVEYQDKPTVEYQVPANKCGLVIGKGGESIRQMKEQSGAHIEMNKHAPHDAPTKAFTIRGTQQQIEAAQQLIAQRIGEPGEGGGYGGGQGGYGGGGHGGGGGGHGGHHGQSPGGMQGGHPGQRMPGHPNPMMAGPQGGAAPAAMAYQAQAQQQQAYYQAYYQQQAYMAQMQGAQMQGAPGANPAAAAAPTPAAAPAGAAGGDSQSVQQQWAAYYQQLVQLYGEQQAQTYWTQLSQHQNAQQGGAPQTSQFDQQQ